MKAEIKVGDVSYDADVIVGSEGEKGLDISKLRDKTGLVTLDPAFVNTAATKSAITFIDGDKGILRYRGIPIEQLAEKSSFVEVAYLLIYGHLPTKDELASFSNLLTRHSMIHEDMKHFFDGYPSTAHPMAVLSAMICSLSSYYPDALDVHVIISALCVFRVANQHTFKALFGRDLASPRLRGHYNDLICDVVLRLLAK